jgi:hypothetical protein
MAIRGALVNDLQRSPNGDATRARTRRTVNFVNFRVVALKTIAV